jgi:cysteine desulfurase
MTDSIYLDFNSTAPLAPAAIAAMNECYSTGYMNPASPHQAGRRARKRLEAARQRIAELLGANIRSASADRLIFTSGGTEANNLALRGLAARPPGRVVVSMVEHPSVAGTADFLAGQGFEILRLPVDASGVVQLDQADSFLDTHTRVVSLMLGNNETGVLQPVDQLSPLCRDANIPLHTDAVQVVGKLPVNFGSLGVSAMTISAHKFQGPRGIGALLVKHGVQLEPVTYGGSQQLGTRPGTESVALAVGMQVALEAAVTQLAQRQQHTRHLRDQLQKHLLREVPGCVVNGAAAPRLPHTLNVSFPGLDRQTLLIALDRQGVCCSTGSACASGAQEPSPVLLAMGCPAEIVDGSLRISLGPTTTPEEVHQAGQILVKTVEKMASF